MHKHQSLTREEGESTYSLLDVVDAEASRESGRAGERRRRRDDFGTVDEISSVMSEDGHLGEGGCESVGELVLVV